MTVETELFTKLTTALSAQVGTRVYPLRAPEKYSTPLLVYQCTQRDFIHDLNGAGDRAISRMQIDVYASSYATASSIATAIKTALTGWTYPHGIFFEGQQDLPEDTVKPILYRVSQDWLIHHDA